MIANLQFNPFGLVVIGVLIASLFTGPTPALALVASGGVLGHIQTTLIIDRPSRRAVKLMWAWSAVQVAAMLAAVVHLLVVVL